MTSRSRRIRAAVAVLCGSIGLLTGGCLPETITVNDLLNGDAEAREAVVREVLPGPTIMRPEWVWQSQGRDVAMAQIGTLAPDLELIASDGSSHTVSFADFRGESVVLYFWATWCSACKENLRALDERARIYGVDGVRFIGVCIDQGGDGMQRTARSNGMNWPTFHDASGVARADFGVGWYPYVVVVGPDGRIQASGLNLVNFDEAIRSLLTLPAS
ncbi:MAG: TlpA family protein disulfide reductase [Planctomycetota bacterium]|jgi:peroxiredoxin